MLDNTMERIGFITSIPVEIILAARHIPVDLNNMFINSPNPPGLVRKAEEHGFPRNFCSWVKGAFQIAYELGIKKVITVSEGECSYSEKMADIMSRYAIMSIPFSYPRKRGQQQLQAQIEHLMNTLQVTESQLGTIMKRIRRIRQKLVALDALSYTTYTISGLENYLWLISSSDFNGDIERFEQKLDSFLVENSKRMQNKYAGRISIGLIGIPPIVNNLFDVIEQLNGIVTYNEMPRQFSMPYYEHGIIEQYRSFTYPYSVQMRLDDIKQEIITRKLEGIIHYIQSFCPRQIDDRIMRDDISIPYLTIECDKPGVLDERNVTKLEAFFERWN